MFLPDAPFSSVHGELAPFLALRDGRPVGRIAAIHNRSHNDYHHDRTGFFGFFDFADGEVAAALFDAACRWLRERGLAAARGPYSPSINDPCGLLSDAFELPPSVFMPWNPARYVDTYRALGLTEIRTLYSFRIPLDVPAPPAVEKMAERARRRSGLTIRPFNMRDIKGELRILQRLYNVTLDRNWGYVPIKWEDLEHSAAGLKAIVDPNMLFFAMHGGREVGYSISLPDINEFARRTLKWPRGFWRFLPLLWLLKTTKPRNARHLILGVEPEFRHRVGVAPMLFQETFKRVGAGGRPSSEISWIEANNTEIVRAIEVMGGRRDKTYTIWEKPL